MISVPKTGELIFGTVSSPFSGNPMLFSELGVHLGLKAIGVLLRSLW